MNDGLKDRHRDAIIALLAANDRVEKAVLFGSRAMETGTDTSDIDIALFGDRLSLTDQARLAAAIDEIPMAQSVDLVLHRTIDHQPLLDHIRTHGIEWYRRPENKADPRLHLHPKHRRMLEGLLREHLPDVEVWAYGSRVNGRSHDGSDLDLVLRGPGLAEIPASQLADFEEAVRESTIPFLVEARDWTRLPERFHREIEREYVVLVCKRSPAAEHEWSQTISSYPFRALGEMSVNYNARRIPVKAADRKPGPYPYYGAQGIVDYVDDYIFDGIFLLVAEDGENLRSRNEDIAFMASGKFWVNNHAHILRANSDTATRFLNYAINYSDISGYITGSTIPKLSQRSLRSILIPSPPPAAQEEIVSFLGALDDKIELNRRMNTTLEAMARAIFKDWFVDFGPTRAKAEGRESYLAPELWDLFPDALDDECKPIGWMLVPLSVLAKVNPESWSKKNAPEQILYVDLANTKWGTIELIQHFLWQDAPSRARRILRPGDTIVGLVRPGNGSYALIGVPDLTGSTGFAVLRPRKFRFRELVFLSATAPDNIERLANLADGAAYPAVRPEAVGATEVAIACNAVTNNFSSFAVLIMERMESNNKENQTLAQTRDLLLPKLMSGEIRIRDAENMVEAVT